MTELAAHEARFAPDESRTDLAGKQNGVVAAGVSPTPTTPSFVVTRTTVRLIPG